jgi:hypothetical protein
MPKGGEHGIRSISFREARENYKLNSKTFDKLFDERKDDLDDFISNGTFYANGTKLNDEPFELNLGQKVGKNLEGEFEIDELDENALGLRFYDKKTGYNYVIFKITDDENESDENESDENESEYDVIIAIFNEDRKLENQIKTSSETLQFTRKSPPSGGGKKKTQKRSGKTKRKTSKYKRNHKRGTSNRRSKRRSKRKV